MFPMETRTREEVVAGHLRCIHEFVPNGSGYVTVPRDRSSDGWITISSKQSLTAMAPVRRKRRAGSGKVAAPVPLGGCDISWDGVDVRLEHGPRHSVEHQTHKRCLHAIELTSSQ